MLIDDRSIKIDSTATGRQTQLEQRDEDDKSAASVVPPASKCLRLILFVSRNDKIDAPFGIAPIQARGTFKMRQ
jgi:hypothetical protein